MSSGRRMSSEDHYSTRDRRTYYNDDHMNLKGYESYPTREFHDPFSSHPSARRYEAGRMLTSSVMDPHRQNRAERQAFARSVGAMGLGAATLDHLVNGPDHRAEEPLEGSKQQAKLSYSLAGPFNRKVCPFDSPAVDGINTDRGTSSNHYYQPRILSPEASPRGGDSVSSSESATCHRLKQKFMKMTPSASVTPGDQTALMNGFSGSSKSLTQLQQKMRDQSHYEKENKHQTRSSKSAVNYANSKPSYPAGPIDEKPGLCPAGISRKVVEGPSGPQYKGFSRGPTSNSLSRGTNAITSANTGAIIHRSDSHGHLFGNRRNDSQNSLNTVQSQPAPGRKPRKENISTRSWRKGQELILRELGPNKASSTPNVKSAAKNDEIGAQNINNSNDERQSRDLEEPHQTAEVSLSRKRKPLTSKSTFQPPGKEITPSKPKVRHYKVSEIRSYLKKQQEARKRKKQDEEAANQARVERVRRQIEELRSQQMDAIKKHVPLPTPISPPEPPPRTLNKTYVIDAEDESDMEDGEDIEMEHERGQPITIQDLETPCKEAPLSPTYQPPREKYHEVWPLRVNGEVTVPPPSAFATLSPRNGDGATEPPVAVASRLTALEESANLLQSRIWQLAHRVGSNSVGEQPQQERLAFSSQSVPYRSDHLIEDDSSKMSPPFLSRYDRLTWENSKNPLEEEPHLPGNTTIPEYPTAPYQFASAAFLDDSTSEASEDYVLHASHKQESIPPLQRQSSKRRGSHPMFRPYSTVGERRKKIHFKDVPPPRRAATRVETPAALRDDPFSFMRTFRRQRHLHRVRPGGDTGSIEQNYEETITSQGESDEEMYSNDFSAEDTQEEDDKHLMQNEEMDDDEEEEEEEEEEYEDDFTSVAAPQTSSQRSVSYSQSHTVPQMTGRSNANSDDQMDSEVPSKRSSYEDSSAARRLLSEVRDEVKELPRPRQQVLLGAAPTSAPDTDLPLRLSPSSLERRLFAELHYLESVEESVRQVGDIERVRAVSMSQQETVSLAQILKARQLAHGQEMRETQIKARQEQLEAMNELRESQQQFAQRANLTAQSIDQTKFTMSANFGRPATDAGQQVSLSRSTPLPAPSYSQPAHSSSWRGSTPPKRRTTDTEETYTSSRQRISAADTDDDESTIQTDTPKFDEQGTNDSTDEDILDHSFRMVLPSEEHRRHGRRTKDVAATNGGHVDINAEESNTPSFRRFTDDMVRQYMREEELRAQHQITLLKLRKNALGEKMHTELEFLETQKRQLVKQHGKSQQQGPHNQLVDKQMALVRRWKQEEAEIDQLLEAQELADKRRQIMLEQDAHISKMKSEAKKIRAEKAKSDDRAKRLDKRSLSDWEQKLHARRQRAEELIRWQEKLKSEEQEVKKLEKAAMKIWKESPTHTEVSAGETATAQRTAASSSTTSSSKTTSSAASVKRRSSPSIATSKSDESAALPRLHIGDVTDTTATIAEEVSTDETSTISQESVVLSTRIIKRSEDESSIQEELDKGTGRSRNDSSNDSISEDVAVATPSVSIRTETIAGGTTFTESVKTDIPTATRTRSPSASYGPDTFESASNTTSRLKRRLGDSVVSSLTSPRGPPKQMEVKTSGGHPPGGRGHTSEDEDSFSCATTTMSEGTEVSDMEGRLHALKEDLKHRVRTLNRLKREKARVNRERLKQKEELLHKHIEMYDKYITDLKAELDHDLHDGSALDSSFGTPVKPQIKAPKATTRDRLRNNSTDDKRLVSESQEILKLPSEKPQKDENEEDVYSMNFTSAAASVRSEKFDEDESSSLRSEPSQKGKQSDAESSSISEALSKFAVSASSSDRGRSTSKSSGKAPNRGRSTSKDLTESNDDDSYSQSFTSAPKSELGTEISEYLPSKIDSTSATSPPQKVRSSSEDSEHLTKQSSSSDSLSTEKKSSIKDVAESVESLSEVLPSSVATKPESESVKIGESIEDVGEATPRTPRRLTFSEINEEYSPSEDTKSKDSVESDVVKPLPSLDLRPLSPQSPELPREKTPELPISPPGDGKQEPLPLSARTIHSQMSDIPEDFPSTDHAPSEKSDDDYSYTEEFSATSSSRPASRSHISEATKSQSSSSTVTASAAPTSVPEENIEAGDSDSWSVEAMDLQKKLSDASVKSEWKLSDDDDKKPSSHLSEILTVEEDVPSNRSGEENTSESEKSVTAVPSVHVPTDSVKEDEKELVVEKVKLAPEDIIEDITQEQEKPKKKVSEEKVAAIVADIFRETLRDTLAVGLASANVTRKKKEETPEVLIESAETMQPKPKELFQEHEEQRTPLDMENEDKISPRLREDSPPPLVRSKSVELIAEDVLAEEVDRALMKRRMKRRLSGEVEIQSPPASPTISVNYLPSDQDSSLSEPLFNDPVVTSTPAAPLISSSEPQETVESPEPVLPTFEPEPIPNESSTPAPSDLRSISPISLNESLRLDEERTNFLVPHARRYLREMVSQAVSDLWPFVSGPNPPRLSHLPTYPSFDFCLVGEAEEPMKGPFASLSEDAVIRNRRAYKHMVYSLILDTVRKIYAKEVPLQPWMCSRPTRYRLWRDTKPPSNLNKLLSIVEDEIETHMGFMPSRKRESKLTQWSRKKRAGLGHSTAISVDPVDDLLKSELRTEEADWVNYESEEFQVKLQVAEGLLMDLIDDTVQAVQQTRSSSCIEASSLSSIPGLLSREIQSGWLDDSNPSLLL